MIYDNLGRLVIQGRCSNYVHNQSYCDKNAVIATFNSGNNGFLGTSYVVPSQFLTAVNNSALLEIANYYDKNQDNIKGDISKYFSDIKITTSVSQNGQQTGSVVAASNGDFTAQVMVYDLKGNLTNTCTREIGGRITSNASTYTYTNKLSFSETYVSMPVGGSLVIGESYNFNNKIDKKSSYTLSLKHGDKFTNSINYAYNELGQLKTITRPLPTSMSRTVTYAYDIRGWLKSITTNSFKEDLFYADCPDKAYNCYNGNIGTMRWSNSNYEQIRGYKFVYDSANRLTDALYGERASLDNKVNRYNEVLEYDENGNITNLQRRGLKQDGQYGKIDNLNLSYNGNQLFSVEEDAKDYDYAGSFEYKRLNGSKYVYNENGSLVADKSRGIAYIKYDYNNNPTLIVFTDGSETEYVYSASGQKLRVTHTTAKPNVVTRNVGDVVKGRLSGAYWIHHETTDYLLGGSLVMKNGKIDKILFDGGYAQATSASSTTDKFAFNYYNQDHLGNNREVVNASGTVTQVTNYYPFGAPYADATAVKGANLQPYKYNGKELDLMHGLNTYDYGARQHDPILCRWDRIDPLCEKYYPYTPYNYCVNNPVSYIDKDGMEPDGWGKALAVAEMVGGAVMATVGAVATGAGVVAEIPTFGGSTVITVSGGSMTLAGCGLMATGLTTWNMASNNNSHLSLSSKSSDSSSKSAPTTNSKNKKVEANDGNAKQHGGSKHDSEINKKINELKKIKGNRHFRKNQQQVDADGNNVGKNRPDIQYDDANGVHHNIELDNNPAQSLRHQKTINANDPNSVNEFIILK
jgi:RHS repeat-associated protein